VVHRQHGAVRGRGRQHLGEPGELVGGQLAVVPAGHGAVEADDAQAGDVVDAVLRGVGLQVEQVPRVRRSLVVVAHHPDDLRADVGSGRLDQLAQPEVGLGLGLVGQVAGEHQRLGDGVETPEPGQRRFEVRLGVDVSVLQRPAGEQVRIAEVGDRVRRVGVLAGLLHLLRLRPRRGWPGV
jgi:hypothetical protein